jgi:hypothetical protein
MSDIVECASCEGYGWQDDENGGVVDCDWCGGVGYVYRDEKGVDRRIPARDFEAVGDRLEALEVARLRRLGYSGSAKKPWEQAVRQRKDREGE